MLQVPGLFLSKLSQFISNMTSISREISSDTRQNYSLLVRTTTYRFCKRARRKSPLVNSRERSFSVLRPKHSIATRMFRWCNVPANLPLSSSIALSVPWRDRETERSWIACCSSTSRDTRRVVSTTLSFSPSRTRPRKLSVSLARARRGCVAIVHRIPAIPRSVLRGDTVY